MAIMSLDGLMKEYLILFAYGADMCFLRKMFNCPSIFMKECSNGEIVVFRVSSGLGR